MIRWLRARLQCLAWGHDVLPVGEAEEYTWRCVRCGREFVEPRA